MPYASLEDFIKAADAIGEVRHVEGADLELDVGCLTELLGERGGPMPVFDKIPGYPAGYRICSTTRLNRCAVFASRWTYLSTFIRWSCFGSGATSAKPPR
ncbi:MAG TPA: hypothetical protein VJ864_05180 [Candidatus Binatia bacterium]|nr:hypothetical protein [Candidatus Binatia bacterium]